MSRKNYKKFESGEYDFNSMTADEKDMVTMDSAEYQEYKNEQHRKNPTLPVNATAMAVLSIVLSCCTAGIPFGIIAIVMAVQSKDENGNRTQQAKIAIMLAVVGILISVVILLSTFMIYKDSIINGAPLEANTEFLDQLIQRLEELESASGR